MLSFGILGEADAVTVSNEVALARFADATIRSVRESCWVKYSICTGRTEKCLLSLISTPPPEIIVKEFVVAWQLPVQTTAAVGLSVK